MEKITLTTPIMKQDIADYEFGSLLLERLPSPRIVVVWVGTDGNGVVQTVTGDEALTKMKALNTVNLSTKSLHKRLMEFAINSGLFIGVIDGTPDV